MLTILKALAVGAFAVGVADIIVKRALDRVEESADQIVSDAINHALIGINLAVDRLEAETGLPVTRRNRHPRLDALIRRLGRKRAA